MPIRWRLTIFHALMILGIVAFLVAVLAVVAIRGTETSVRETARARALEATRVLEAGSQLDAPTLAQLATGGVDVVARDAAGLVLARTPLTVLEADNEGADAFWQGALASGTETSGSVGEAYVIAVPIVSVGSPARVVEAWKSYDATGESLLPIGPHIVFALPVTLLLAVGGSYILARSALAPVDAIVRSARDMTESDLSQRLPVARERDEIGRLATTFNDLLARLEAAFEQREEVLADQRRFVADASHELRTPLTSILGYARMLRQWGLSDPIAAPEGVAAIEREAARMNVLVESLLNLAQGDESPRLALGRHDLQDIASAAVETARAIADDKQTVVYDSPTEPVYATVDPDRLRQAAGILLDNALKYSPRGGAVTVSLRSNDGCAELAVSDTGIGISAEHLPHVFDRFYRIDAARGAGGTGLGLAIARQIAESHGGTIEVTSVAGCGSRFSLCLPSAASVVAGNGASAGVT